MAATESTPKHTTATTKPSCSSSSSSSPNSACKRQQHPSSSCSTLQFPPVNNEDDDCSSSKTNQTTMTTRSHSCSTRKSVSVSFDEQENMYIPNDRTDKESCADLWYHNKDYMRFKALNMKKACHVIKGHGKVSMFWCHVLERAFLQVHQTARESQEGVDYYYNEESFDFGSSVLSDSEQEHLQTLYSTSKFCPLGIECLIVDCIANDVACRRCEQMDRIYEIEQTIGMTRWHWRQDLIRVACQSLSLGPRLLAREAALALAASLRDQHHQQPQPLSSVVHQESIVATTQIGKTG